MGSNPYIKKARDRVSQFESRCDELGITLKKARVQMVFMMAECMTDNAWKNLCKRTIRNLKPKVDNGGRNIDISEPVQ